MPIDRRAPSPVHAAWWQFGPALKAPGSERTLTADQTHARIKPLLRRIPITRVSDVTPLDELGMPIFSAVTPLAADLSIHMGKGLEKSAARVSAMMEAIERVSAEQIPGETRTASYAELAARPSTSVLDPAEFDLPPDSEFSPERPISWVSGRDLLTDREVLVPVDLVVNPPREGVLKNVDTNGLASGNLHVEAVVHGICEVIERDAFSQLLFVMNFGEHTASIHDQPIRPVTLPDTARAWLGRLAGAGLAASVRDITSEYGVATIEVRLTDPAYPFAAGPAPMTFLGLGTHPNAEIALNRAISEAVQARLAFIQAARDSYNTLPRAVRRSELLAQAQRNAARHEVDFSEVPSHQFADVREDLDYVLSGLRRAGVRHCIAVDLTRPDWAIPVVRIRIPRAAAYCVNRRRVGPRALRHLL